MTTNTLRNLSIDFVSLVPQGADPDAHIMLAKAHKPDPTKTSNPAAPTRGLPIGKEAPMAELNETVVKALGEDHGFKLTDEQIAGLNALATEPTPDPTPEATPEAAPAARMPDGTETATADAAITKAIEPIQKRLEAAEESLAKEVEGREIAIAIEKARTDYAGLSVDPDEIGPAVYRMTKGTGTEEDAKIVTSALAAASTQNAMAKISEPIGFEGDAPEGTPAATVEALAKDIQTADPTVGTLAARVAAATSAAGRVAYEAANAD